MLIVKIKILNVRDFFCSIIIMQVCMSSFHENKKLFNIYDIYVNKILVSKKEPYGKKIHLNTTLDMIIMTTLDHYK